eukprot:1137235-Pelagomonas_calceolata.AAC.9
MGGFHNDGWVGNTRTTRVRGFKAVVRLEAGGGAMAPGVGDALRSSISTHSGCACTNTPQVLPLIARGCRQGCKQRSTWVQVRSACLHTQRHNPKFIPRACKNEHP